MKNKWMTLLTIMLCVSIFVGCGNKKESKKMETTTVNGLSFEKLTIKVNKDNSKLKTNISNPSKDKIYVKKVRIKLYDKDGNLKMEIIKKVDKDIDSNSKFELSHKTNVILDDIDVAKTEYELIEE